MPRSGLKPAGIAGASSGSRLSRSGHAGGFLQQWDVELSARDAGDAAAVRRLRRLHWGGMLCNAILLFAIVVSIPYVSATA